MPTGKGKTADTYLKTAGSYIKTGDFYYSQYESSDKTDMKAYTYSQGYYKKAKEVIAKTKDNFQLTGSVDDLFSKAKKDTEERRKK